MTLRTTPNRATRRRLRLYRRRVQRNEQVVLRVLAVGVGAAAAFVEILFRLTYSGIQGGALGFTDTDVVTFAADQPWWWLLLGPALGGLVIGAFVQRYMPEGRPHAVADAIAAASVPREGLRLMTGVKAALVNAASIGVGASVGREGPMVHAGATLGSVVASALSLQRSSMRTLLGCGVAAGVAASFNAPIAGVFFALEVVIRHYALNAFAPIVIASVTGTVVSRWWYGDFPAFVPPESYGLASQWEFLAFAVLGVVCAGMAIALMQAIMRAGDAFRASPLPIWTRPGVAGLAVGAMAALGLPHVLGVGYEATSAALAEAYDLELLALLAVAKIAATALCLGAGFGGGVFSPSVYIGAMTGGVFGLLVTAAFPEVSASPGAYAIVGMGAVAGSVLGAPISTILIVFELTGNYELTVGVMVATVIASEITANTFARSLFHWQLARRGINLRGGEEDAVLHDISVAALVHRDIITARPETPLADLYERLGHSTQRAVYVLDAGDRLLGEVSFAVMAEALARDDAAESLQAQDVMRPARSVVTLDGDLAEALDIFGASSQNALPVVDNQREQHFQGLLRGYDLMRAYHKALREVREVEQN